MRMLWSLLLVFGIAGVASCSKDGETTVTPAGRGARGETCTARNDCAGGLACVNGTCSKNDFDVALEAKHCDRVECGEDEDCCGDLPREAPQKCNDRTLICYTPTLPDCTPGACDSDSDCGSGVCNPGQCSASGDACETDSDCPIDECVSGYCSVSAQYCSDTVACPIVAATCGYRSCNCANPDYNSLDPICTDPDCDNVCTLRCDAELCVPDTSCDDDDDCLGTGSDICEEGRCVECLEDDDCDGDEEACVANFCEEPCTENEECPLFHACEDGDCVERGCGSDTECILAASRTGSAEDPRLFQCLPTSSEDDTRTCKLPCENDAGCASSEVCDDGFCVFIGCNTNEECRAYLGIEDEETSDQQPYIPKAVCRD